MKIQTIPTLIRLTLLLLLTAAITLLSQHPTPSTAAPESSAPLTLTNVGAPAINCLFDPTCTLTVEDTISSFTFDNHTGTSFLQSRLLPRGAATTPGAGLFPYEYRIDMRQMAGIGNPACVTNLTLDFGPIVPLDYNDDGSLEHIYIVTSGGLGTVAPSSANQTGSSITFTFSPPVCSDFSPDINNGQSTFFFGLASPFRDQEVTAVLNHNLGDPLNLPARAPEYGSAAPITLSVIPNEGRAGDTVQLVGSGYTPGSYPGAIRWNGADDATFTIPSGGAFSTPYTIPTDAALEEHTITVCSLNPCATGEFEQSASVPFRVTEPPLPSGAYQTLLPAIVKPPTPVTPQPFSYVVDGTVQPYQPTLPAFSDGAPRPLTAVRSPNGTTTTFVANEVVLQTNDPAELAAFLTRTGGTILLEIDPAAAGIPDVAKTYLVRVNLATAVPSTLTANITNLIPPDVQSAGQFTYGSNSGVQLFSIAAAEANSGLTVGVNWVSQTLAIPNFSREAPAGPGGYNRNAYNWPHFAQGTTQDIGVPEAWNLLHNGGKTGNQVDIAILDGGFFPNSDFPSGTTYLNIFPFDPRNVNGVDGGAPFHGTDVLQTAAATGDNNFGIVGVAAPIAHPIALYTSYDYAVSIGSVVMARAAGARVLNMSYSASVPAIFAWTVWPFEITTVAVRASGALLFASAGNDGINVDGEDCFIICWEHTWITPCENAGVICVGGLGWDSQMRAGNSNFGAGNVDIYAPYTVYSGQAPDTPGGGVTAGFINGTSFSSPYAASVAALIWAANPGLSANQVWQLMVDTAHSSPDGRVNRYVNAYDAVLQAIGVSGSVNLLSPVNGATYEMGTAVPLRAQVGYVTPTGGTPVQLRWFVDGTAVSTTNFTPGIGGHTFNPETYIRTLGPGSHTARIRLTAGSLVIERTVTFTINNTPPIATIDQPATGSSFCVGETVTLRGSAFDPNELPSPPDSAFAWRSNINGALGTGPTRTTTTLSVGSHTITLRVTDSGGLWDEDSIALTILAASNPACVDLNPSALITSPANNYSVYADQNDGTYWYKQITFTGVVDDTEDNINELTVQWFSDLQGSLGTPIVNPTTGVTTLTANVRAYGSCGSTHIITLRVTDTAGNITEDQITIYVNVLC